MELVLSPGRIGGGDGSGAPFQNEEVREWSHVDRLTGMLERARIETGRWQSRKQGAAQAYGKVIDSRERNSADGSVVQRARRQVEVFQSQGVGGRSVQVVRASQWSSSRVTDSTSSSPIPISMNDAHYKNGIEEGPEVKTAFGRLGNEDDSGLSRLTQVSRLCRQIHAETVSNRTSLRLKANTSPLMNRRIKAFETKESRRSPSLLNGKKSTSNEDVSNMNEKFGVKSPAKFTRDCKVRRSLQVAKSSITPVSVTRRIFDDKSVNGNGVRVMDSNRKSKVSTYGVSATTDYDEYSTNGRSELGGMDIPESSMSEFNKATNKLSGRQIKSYVLGMKSSVNGSTDVSPSSSDIENHRVPAYSFKNTTASQNDKDVLEYDSYNEYLQPIPMSTTSRSVQSTPSASKANTTVVHLSNSTPPRLGMEGHSRERVVSTRSTGDKTVILPTGTVQCRIQSLTNRYSLANATSKESELYKFKPEQMMDERPGLFPHSPVPLPHQERRLSNEIETVRHPAVITDGTVDSIVRNFSPERKSVVEEDHAAAHGKPVKKVGFCKTEVHFAADSGKVNIVETDGKPPPSNKFRRRRRNSLVVNMPINKSLPLIHFGDTSYEKYIFGQSSSLQNNKPASPDLTLMRRGQEPEVPVGSTQSNDSQDSKNGWGVKLRAILQTDHESTTSGVEFDSHKSYDGLDEIITDHKHRGHTTKVNLGANVLSKIKHINRDETGIKSVDELLVNGSSESIAPAYPTSIPTEERIENDTISKECQNPILSTANDSNIVSSDNENNQVLLNVVTTHEPIIARVENIIESPKLGKRSSPSGKRSSQLLLEHEITKKSIRGSHKASKSNSAISKNASIKQKAKDHCDNSPASKARSNFSKGDLSIIDPPYANVFVIAEKNAPIYENCQIINKTTNEKEPSKTSRDVDSSLIELKHVTDEAMKSINGHSNMESSQSSTECEDDPPNKTSSQFIKQNLTTISENKSSSTKSSSDNHKTKQTKTRSKRSLGPTSSTSSIESVSLSPTTRTMKNRETRYLNGKSMRTGHLHEMSNNHQALVKKTRESRNPKEIREVVDAGKARPKASHLNRPANLPTSANAIKDRNGSTRSKKPIEIVYQTAVFNMKNEKLSKPSKTKESKSPRYINDLICGSKTKRPVDVRHAKGITSSQQRIRNKSASPTRRHWK